MKLFLHYLRSKALKIGAFLLFALLFLVSFRLYHLPLAAVWYPSALCAALGLVILLLDFRRVRQRHLELQQILQSLPTLPETLPQPQAVLEEDYRALTRALLAQQRTLETQLNSRYQDMLDYYTLWAHQIKTPIASMRLSLQQEDTPKARQLLQELGCSEDKVIPVMNQCDKVPEIHALPMIGRGVRISALTGEGIDTLLAGIEQALSSAQVRVELVVPYDRYDVMQLLYSLGAVQSESHEEDGTHVTALLDESQLWRVQKKLS